MGVNPNILSVDTLAMSGIGYTSNFNISVSNSEYIEDINGNRTFVIKGLARDTLGSERRFRERFTKKSANMVGQVMTLDGKITTVVQQGQVYNQWMTPHKSTPIPIPRDFTVQIKGNENLPDDIMQVKLIVRADNYGASNVLTITKTLISNISDEVKFERESKRLADEEDLRLKEEKILQDNEMELKKIETPISDITNPIITVPQGYHKMPDGTIMKDSEHKTEREKLIEKSSVAILLIGGIGLYLALRFKK